MADKLVGVISHYFNKIGVAVLRVTDCPIKLGDRIKIVKGEDEFEQEVTSMQIEHQPVKQANPGEEVGLKVEQPVRKNAKVYLVEDN